MEQSKAIKIERQSTAKQSLLPEKYQHLKELTAEQAPLVGREYGHAGLGIHIQGSDTSEEKHLREVNPNREYVPIINKRLPEAQIDLTRLVYAGGVSGWSIRSTRGSWRFEQGESQAEELANYLEEEFLQFTDEIVVLRGLAATLRRERERGITEKIEKINSFLEEDERVKRDPFYEIVESKREPEDDDDYMTTHFLAPLVAVDVTSNNRVVSLLRGKDGEIGYKIGGYPTYLWR